MSESSEKPKTSTPTPEPVIPKAKKNIKPRPYTGPKYKYAFVTAHHMGLDEALNKYNELGSQGWRVVCSDAAGRTVFERVAP